MSGAELPEAPVRDALRLAQRTLPMIKEDHPLTQEITVAEDLLPALAGL
ncbi:hypothetical protein [Streptomyces sp. RKAG290]|nr:hypothetical protein [Streptomyces sp. RKAG290]MCM2416439.1 hypothetical protein [Streptomyces sp. RKAG290]